MNSVPWDYLTDSNAWFLTDPQKLVMTPGHRSGKSYSILTTQALKEAYQAMVSCFEEEQPKILSPEDKLNMAVDEIIGRGGL